MLPVLMTTADTFYFTQCGDKKEEGRRLLSNFAMVVIGLENISPIVSSEHDKICSGEASALLHFKQLLKSLVPATVQPSSYRVLVTNLHPSVSQEDIDELFGDIGSVLHSALTKPGSAIVTFRTREEALRACHTYHNRHLDDPGLPMYCNLMETQQALPISSRTSFNLIAYVICVNKSLQHTSCTYFVKMDKIEYHAVIKFFFLDQRFFLKLNKFIQVYKSYGNSAPSFLSVKKWAAKLNLVARLLKINNLKDGQKLQPHRQLLQRRVKVCEIAEAVGISGESVRNILYEEKGMPKALHKVGTAFAECRSKANAQMTFALYQFKRDPTDFVR
ncbi:POLDIP3 [Cordylochernes scorpioides]|uniref:POLDIP3 n=1 Tax=Cordylochernes scorpioides TaxID=51811 RepID=A0ABY6KP82_9ARAC|nr:POLDIP3 [Cordylochernes scorpioides]